MRPLRACISELYLLLCVCSFFGFLVVGRRRVHCSTSFAFCCFVFHAFCAVLLLSVCLCSFAPKPPSLRAGSDPPRDDGRVASVSGGWGAANWPIHQYHKRALFRRKEQETSKHTKASVCPRFDLRVWLWPQPRRPSAASRTIREVFQMAVGFLSLFYIRKV